MYIYLLSLFFFVKSWIYIVYIIIQLKYGNTDQNQNRLIGDNYFHIFVTPGPSCSKHR